MAEQAQPIKVMTDYKLSDLTAIRVEIKRYNIKPVGKPQPLERSVDDQFAVAKLVHVNLDVDVGKLFEKEDIIPNVYELPDDAYATSQFSDNPVRKNTLPLTGPIKPKPGTSRRRSASDSTDGECSHSMVAKPSNATISEVSSPPAKVEKRKRTNRSSSRTSRSRSPVTNNRRESRSRSNSPPHSRSRYRSAPVRNLSDKPGEFRPDKNSSRVRERHSISRTPSPPYQRRHDSHGRSRDRRRSREGSAERRSSKRHSRSKSPKRRSQFMEMSEYHPPPPTSFYIPQYDPHMRPHLRPDMMMRFPYAPVPYAYAPGPMAPYLPVEQHYGPPMHYRPRYPLPKYQNRMLPDYSAKANSANAAPSNSKVKTEQQGTPTANNSNVKPDNKLEQATVKNDVGRPAA